MLHIDPVLLSDARILTACAIFIGERAAAEGVVIGFREYVRVGLPVTIATLGFGAVWLWLSA